VVLSTIDNIVWTTFYYLTHFIEVKKIRKEYSINIGIFTKFVTWIIKEKKKNNFRNTAYFLYICIYQN